MLQNFLLLKEKQKNNIQNPNQPPQDDTCSIRKFHPYSQYSIHAHAMDRRSDKYVRLCIIPITASAGIVIDSTYCTMTPFVPNVSQNDTCYYAARYSHEEMPSNFRSRNLWWRDNRYKMPVFPPSGSEEMKPNEIRCQQYTVAFHAPSKLCLRREEAMVCRLRSSRSAFTKSNWLW